MPAGWRPERHSEIARYTRVAALLHWLIATLVISLLPLGLLGETLEHRFGAGPIYLHMSLGLTVFALTVLRVLWRITHHPPRLPEHLRLRQRSAAAIVHSALYALLILLPISGYIFLSESPYPLLWFGQALPKLGVSHAIGEGTEAFHQAGGYTIVLLVGAHIGAALFHQFILRDRLLARMSPFFRKT